MPIYTFIDSSGDIFCLAVAILYVTMLATNRQQLSYEWDQIGPFFCLKSIEFISLLIFIHSFILELAVASSGVWSMQGWICWT